MLVNINYNKQIYRLLYEDKCAYWLDEPDEFKYILLDMCVSHPIINKCIVCHESKMGRYMNCCDYKQFMCVNCISQMYTLEMYDCPSCRKTFIYDLMFIIQHHSKYKKYIYLRNHVIRKVAHGVKLYSLLNELEESDECFFDEVVNIEVEDIFVKDNNRNLKNRIKHENKCKFTKIKKKSGYYDFDNIWKQNKN